MPQVPGLDTGRRPPEAVQVTDSGVQARLLTGRIARGRLMGTRVLLKVLCLRDAGCAGSAAHCQQAMLCADPSARSMAVSFEGVALAYTGCSLALAAAASSCGLAAAPLQAYPAAESEQAATMAANEAAAHAALQPPAVAAECDQLAKLLGSFSPRGGPHAGEQVRVLDVVWRQPGVPLLVHKTKADWRRSASVKSIARHLQSCVTVHSCCSGWCSGTMG